MVGLLEELEGADAAGLEGAEIVDLQGRDVDVDAADLAVAALDVVDGRDAVEHVLKAAVPGIRLAGHEQDALVPLVDQRLHLVADLLLGEGTPLELLIAHAEGTVEAVVVAEVADVERGEEHEARAVDGVLGVARRLEELGQQLGVAHRGEDRDLVHLEALELPRLGEDLADAGGVLGGRRAHRLVDAGLVDERSCPHNGCHVLLPRSTGRGSAQSAVAGISKLNSAHWPCSDSAVMRPLCSWTTRHEL